MNHTTFYISYDGPAIENGTIDVKDLAPALLAVGQLLNEANNIINGKNTKASVRVKATEIGSFEIELIFIQTVWEQVIHLISSDSYVATKEIIRYVFGGGGTLGLICLIKRLRGRKAKQIDKNDDLVIITLEDGTTIEMPEKTFRLWHNDSVRKSLKELVSTPLKTNEIDVFNYKDEEHESSINKEESNYFDQDTIGQNLIEFTTKKAFRIRTISFRRGNQWKLHDGDSIINVHIEDKEFFDRVENSEISFAINDILICELRTEQFTKNGDIKNMHFIKRVISHKQNNQLNIIDPRYTNFDSESNA